MTEDAGSVAVCDAPNARAGAASAGLGHGDVFPKANAGLLDDAASSSLLAVTGTEDLDPPAQNENPGVPEATAPLLPSRYRQRRRTSYHRARRKHSSQKRRIHQSWDMWFGL